MRGKPWASGKVGHSYCHQSSLIYHCVEVLDSDNYEFIIEVSNSVNSNLKTYVILTEPEPHWSKHPLRSYHLVELPIKSFKYTQDPICLFPLSKSWHNYSIARLSDHQQIPLQQDSYVYNNPIADLSFHWLIILMG